MGILKTIGNWLLALANTMGGPGLLLIAIADSSFLSLPEGNDLLIVVLSIGKSWEVMSYYCVMTTLGSVIGCHLLFWVGKTGGRSALESRFKKSTVERVESFVSRYGVSSVMIPSIIPPPMPFKVFVLTAGVFQMDSWKFLVAVLAGRSIRYFTWGILAVLYGEKVKNFMATNLKLVGILTLLVLVLIVVMMAFRNFRGRRSGSAAQA